MGHAPIDGGVSLGLLLTSFTLGVRHGFDWDHIAAIADLSGTAESRRRGFVLSMLYAVGHGAVVFVLGTVAIAFGLAIPDGFDEWMGKVVGVTLIALGAWILLELIRKGRDFRLRSRWMLMINGTFAGMRKVRGASRGGRTIEVEHQHDHEHLAPTSHDHAARHAHDHAHSEAGVSVAEPVPALTGWRSARQRLRHGHNHSHRHELALPTDATARYGNGTAAGIGMLHGVGVESPTQIAIFVASTAAVGVSFGLLLLATWVAGLIIANAAIAALAGAGLLHAERSFPIYAGLAVVVSVMSIGLGVLYLLGLDILPGILT